MYIKIKNIKRVFLIIVCISLASFNYLTYAETNRSNIISGICDKTIDSDCDNLTDAEEKLYGTDPNNADTDGDSYSDGVEVESGYDPLKSAPGDEVVIKEIKNYTSNFGDKDNMSSSNNNFSQELITFVQSKDGVAITTSDMNNFVTEQLEKNMLEKISFDTLPEIDTSQIKIFPQDYSSLSQAEKKQKETEDAVKYAGQMLYLLLSNAPVQISTPADFYAFQDDFFSHMVSLSTLSTTKSEYFSDLANRLEVFSNQALKIKVPETMLPLHIKFLRIIKGITTLQSYSVNDDELMEKVFVLTRVTGYVNLLSIFFQNDFNSYFKQIENN